MNIYSKQNILCRDSLIWLIDWYYMMNFLWIFNNFHIKLKYGFKEHNQINNVGLGQTSFRCYLLYTITHRLHFSGIHTVLLLKKKTFVFCVDSAKYTLLPFPSRSLWILFSNVACSWTLMFSSLLVHGKMVRKYEVEPKHESALS
jgi:hypothetical protein